MTPIRIEIFDYYRLVRNLATHRYDPDEEGTWGEEADTGRHRKRLDAKLKRIRERFAEQLPEFVGRLAAPNEYDALNFDDFVLATRNMKHVATALSDISRPPDEALLAALDVDVQRFHRSHPSNEARIRRRIASAARARFGIDQAEAEHVASLWVPHGAR